MRNFNLSAAELLERLIASGAELRLVGDDLQIKINGGVDSKLREEIKTNKNGLVRLVEAGEHKLPPVIWIHRPEDNRMIWKTLNTLGETTPSTPVNESQSKQLALTGVPQ